MAGAGVISCPDCGASYPWRPQLAGKKVRCKCGKLFAAHPPRALAAQPVAEPELIPVDEDSDVSVIPSKRKMPTVMRPATGGTGGGAATAMSASSPSAAQLAAAYPTHGRRRVVAQEGADDDSKKKLIVPLIAILVLLVGGGIFAGLALKGGMIGSSKPMLGDDEMIVGMIKDENGTEVKEWLRAHSRHMFMNMTEGQAIGFADRLYALGAVKIYSFGEMISRSVAVELPDDPAKRKALFEFEREHNGFRSKTKDVGQKFFLLWM